MSRRLSAVSFLDIVEYTRLMSYAEDLTHQRWMQVLSEAVRPMAQEHRGRVVKSTGDGVLAEFSSVHEAVEWAQEVQAYLAGRAADDEAPDVRLNARIAIHLCDVYVTDDDLYGDGVNIAARLQEHAPSGGIIVTEAVRDSIRGTTKTPLIALGPLELKNLPEPVNAYVLDTETVTPSVRREHAETLLPSIAVLPLRNSSKDADDDYFGEGVVEDIVVSLASLRELVVIARTSTLAIGRRQLPPLEAGRALAVRYVLAGRIRRTTDSVRVSVQLYDVAAGTSLWGDTATVKPAALFEYQDRIVRRIVTGIAPHVRSAELRRAMRKRPESFTAYDHTLQALNGINSLERTTFYTAFEHLQRAIADDPDFAMPLAWAARWHSVLIGQGWSTDPRRDSDRGAQFAGAAIELDRQNALALATYGHLQAYLFHDYDSALVHFDRALSACPNSALAWILSSGTLSYIGHGERAIRHAERAIRLSPFDQSLFYFYTFLALAHYTAGHHEQAERWAKVSLKEKPQYTATLRILAAALAAQDRAADARIVGANLAVLEPEFSMAHYAEHLQPFRDNDIRDTFIARLEMAGLPP